MVYSIIKYYIHLFLGRFKMLVLFTGCDVRYEKKNQEKPKFER